MPLTKHFGPVNPDADEPPELPPMELDMMLLRFTYIEREVDIVLHGRIMPEAVTSRRSRWTPKVV